MKKFLTVLSAVAVAGAINSASAMDRTGKFGIGYQENIMFSTTASNAQGTWSLKYGFTPQFVGQFLIGFGFDNFNANSNMAFGARGLYNLVSKENSDFYTGFGIVYNMDDNESAAVADNSSLTMQIPLGFEWSFAGLPEIGFNAEAGLLINYMIDAEKWQFTSAGGSIGGNLGLGVHYYF